MNFPTDRDLPNIEQSPFQIVPYIPSPPIRTWPNVYTLFTVVTLVNNVACLLFPNYSILKGLNVAMRCSTIVYSYYYSNIAKIATEKISLVAMLFFNHYSLVTSIADLVFEGINFSRCEVSVVYCKSFLNNLFKPKPTPTPKILHHLIDPTVLENACTIFRISKDQINDLDRIEKHYKKVSEANRERYEYLLKKSFTILAEQVKLIIDNHDEAYRTLKKHQITHPLVR